MSVPLLDLRPQHEPIRTELIEAIAAVCDSQRFVLGDVLEAFEAEIAAHLGVRHAVGVSSGTDALLVALMALGVGPGDEVVTSAYSFFATAGSIVRLGARPVFVDIDPTTFNLVPEQVASAITNRTKAIMPVHLFGQSAELRPITRAADEAGVPVVEDAAQAIGARDGDRTVGGVGAMGCFSFFPSKNLGALGDGGLVVTNDSSRAETLRRLRHHGQGDAYVHDVVGGNFRLDAIQAAVLRVKLAHLDAWTERRRANARRYAELFAAAGLTDRIALPRSREDVRHVFNQFVIRSPRRDALRAHLGQRGIGTAVYYPVPLHLQPCFEHLGHRPGDRPQAERAAAECLALPIYPGLTEDQQHEVVRGVASFF